MATSCLCADHPFCSRRETHLAFNKAHALSPAIECEGRSERRLPSLTQLSDQDACGGGSVDGKGKASVGGDAQDAPRDEDFLSAILFRTN